MVSERVLELAAKKIRSFLLASKVDGWPKGRVIKHIYEHLETVGVPRAVAAASLENELRNGRLKSEILPAKDAIEAA